MAGLATHRSAEPETLVVRVGFEERAWLMDDAPEAYYITDYYRSHPGKVLVAASLAIEYGFTDIDGATPRPLTLADV